MEAPRSSRTYRPKNLTRDMQTLASDLESVGL